MKLLNFLLLLSIGVSIQAQNLVNGTIIDNQNEKIVGANVYLEGTYDGSFSDAEGDFSFATEKDGKQMLVISYLGYQTKQIEIELPLKQAIQVILKPTKNTFKAVQVTASTFSAGGSGKNAVLKPLDMVTTAGSLGDVIGAIQTLPGTQANAEDGRLFVRGGEASETAILVDGMRVFTPYTRGFQGIPVRGRFSPFLFKGVNFNSGGYSAAYGQALSGVLNMETIDQVESDETNISLMTLGMGIGHTKKWQNNSLSINASYINFAPYLALYPGRLENTKPYEGVAGEAIYRHQLKDGIAKTYIAADHGRFGIKQQNLNNSKLEAIDITNNNYYLNSTVKKILNDKTSIFTGLSIGYNHDKINIDDEGIATQLFGLQYRFSAKTILSEDFTLDYGLEHLWEWHDFQQEIIDQQPFESQYDFHISTAFLESQYYFSEDLAVKVGFRTEYTHAIQETQCLPRLTIAQKMSENAQISLSYGLFSQYPTPTFAHANAELHNERGQHFLVNYNLKTKKQHLRLEAFYKSYSRLVRFPSQNQIYQSINNGLGYAYGLDAFWRMNQSIKNYEFWVSYSLLFTERKYRDFPQWARPNFATQHNLSFVNKLWIPKLKSQVGLTYQFASGRPYHNPNLSGFMQELSKPFHNVNINWAYLISQQKILYFSIQNAPNIQNEFGKRFADFPNENGIFPSETIKPAFDQMFFVGFFWTISDNKKRNQLDQL